MGISLFMATALWIMKIKYGPNLTLHYMSSPLHFVVKIYGDVQCGCEYGLKTHSVSGFKNWGVFSYRYTISV